MIGRFIIVNTIGLGLLLSTFLTGLLDVVIEADNVYALPIAGLLTACGLGCIAMKNFKDAEWIANKMPVLALIGTVMGIMIAVHGALAADLPPDMMKMRVFTDVSYSLVANMLGMIGYFWLELVIRVCKGETDATPKDQ